MGTYSKIPVSETTGKTELQTETPVSSPNISRFKNTLASGHSIQDTALSSSVNLEKKPSLISVSPGVQDNAQIPNITRVKNNQYFGSAYS